MPSPMQRLLRLLRPTPRLPRRTRLTLETLETRLVPTTAHWTGLAALPGLAHPDPSWSNTRNWLNDVAPQEHDTVDFPNGAAGKTSIDDLPAGTPFAAITIEGDGYQIGGNAVQLQGGIRNTFGVNTVSLAITLGADQTFSDTGGSSLVLTGAINNNGHTLSINSQNNLVFEGSSISGSGGLTVGGGGKFFLDPTRPDTYTGLTAVPTPVTLILGGAQGNAIPGNLAIGAGSGNVEAEVVRLAQSNEIARSCNVTMKYSGMLDLNGYDNTIASLTMTGGNVVTGTGRLTISGDVTTLASSYPALIAGNLALGSGVFNVAGGGLDKDLNVTANVINGPGNTLTKEGAGIMQLIGNNTWTGQTTVTGGTLIAASANALGPVGSGVQVGAGATLRLAGGIDFGPKPLSLNGTGVGGTAGALQIASGNNTWRGPIRLFSPSTIVCAAGATFTDSVEVTNDGNLLTVNAQGNVTFATTLTGAGGLTNKGAGTLTFSTAAPNLYTGTTTVSAGILVLAKPAGIPALSGPLVINAGGTLAGSGTIDGSVINGGVISPGGTNALGTLVINGDYTQKPGGTLEMEVASTRAFDQLKISGAASLDGTLDVHFLNGFVPVPGDVFALLTFRGSTGHFKKVELPNPGSGKTLGIEYDARDVSLACGP